MPAKKTKLAGAKRICKTARQAETTNNPREFERAFDIVAKCIMTLPDNTEEIAASCGADPLAHDLTFHDGDVFAC